MFVFVLIQVRAVSGCQQPTENELVLLLYRNVCPGREEESAYVQGPGDLLVSTVKLRESERPVVGQERY